MTPLIEKTWDAFCVGAKIMCNEDPHIIFDPSRKENYFNTFKRIHAQILQYMEDEKLPLDRHKIASIIIVSGLTANVLESQNEKGVFLGNYILATEVALSYMLGELNEVLKEQGQNAIDSFFFPKAISCNTDYFRILYRNLYYSQNNAEWGLNPLDMAERLFLLEYMTLNKNGIDPEILKEY